jgi:hypothetical protein
MRMMAFGIAVLLACSSAPAFAGASTAGSSAMGVGTSASSKTTSPDNNNNKVVLQARDDARRRSGASRVPGCETSFANG